MATVKFIKSKVKNNNIKKMLVEVKLKYIVFRY